MCAEAARVFQTLRGQVAGTPRNGGDRFLVNRHATFLGRGALIRFRPEPGFFHWGLLFVGQSRLSVYPKGKGF